MNSYKYRNPLRSTFCFKCEKINNCTCKGSPYRVEFRGTIATKQMKTRKGMRRWLIRNRFMFNAPYYYRGIHCAPDFIQVKVDLLKKYDLYEHFKENYPRIFNHNLKQEEIPKWVPPVGKPIVKLKVSRKMKPYAKKFLDKGNKVSADVFKRQKRRTDKQQLKWNWTE